ncbi:MAG TPA: two-component sensor histidine kinase, partial [Phycisphaerae bacterium]|nr:two-component sensor histidine kinase [Phycisphaerae bacterium]
MADERPNPDELLARVTEEEQKSSHGKLKIFFGMSAGVGKTYAMLEEARKRAEEGTDVLIGYAEPHIRPETEALLLGLEILPYKIVDYKGAKLKEFDLD